MTVFVFVHGTFDADLEEGRQKWWEPSGPFAQGLLTDLGSRTDDKIVPFKWSGENSDRDRRRGGRRLLNKLLALEKEGRPYHLVGHSHGGSVITHALERAAQRDRRLDQLKSIVTVGTPFFDYRSNSFAPAPILEAFKSNAMPFLQLLGTGLFILFSLLFGALLVSRYGLNNMAWYVWVFSSFGLFWILSLFHFPRLFRASLSLFFGREDRFKQRIWEKLQAEERRWLFLHHRDDEAINGLSFAVKQKRLDVFRNLHPSAAIASIIRQLFILLPLASLALTFLLPAALLFLLPYVGYKLYLEIQNGNPLLEAVQRLEMEFGYLLMTPGYVGLGLVFAALLGITVLVASKLVEWVGRLVLDLPYRLTLARLLDGVVAKSVASKSTGEDQRGYSVKGCSAVPAFSNAEAHPLPEPIHSEIREAVDENSGATLSRIRTVLGGSILTATTPELVDALAKEVRWNELVHTSYFANRKVASLIAYGIAKNEGRATSPIMSGAEAAQLETWLLEIQTNRSVDA